MNEEYDYIINAFTKDGDNVNEEIDNLNVGCITSKNNKFSLDSEGNLIVKSITTESGARVWTLTQYIRLVQYICQ